MEKDNGLQAIEAFCIDLLAMSIRISKPYLTRRVIWDTMTRVLAEDEPVSTDVLSVMLQVSRAQVYRDRKKDEPDQYSVIQRVAGYLCPLYPEWRSAWEIFSRVGPYEEDLSISLFQELLDYYVHQEYLEVEDGRYRVRGPLVWFDEEVSSKLERVKRYAPQTAKTFLGYLRGKKHCNLHAIGIHTTESEFEVFLAGMKDFIKQWLSEHCTRALPDEEGFLITILTSPQELEQLDDLKKKAKGDYGSWPIG